MISPCFWIETMFARNISGNMEATSSIYGPEQVFECYRTDRNQTVSVRRPSKADNNDCIHLFNLFPYFCTCMPFHKPSARRLEYVRGPTRKAQTGPFCVNVLLVAIVLVIICRVVRREDQISMKFPGIFVGSSYDCV